MEILNLASVNISFVFTGLLNSIIFCWLSIRSLISKFSKLIFMDPGPDSDSIPIPGFGLFNK